MAMARRVARDTLPLRVHSKRTAACGLADFWKGADDCPCWVCGRTMPTAKLLLSVWMKGACFWFLHDLRLWVVVVVVVVVVRAMSVGGLFVIFVYRSVVPVWVDCSVTFIYIEAIAHYTPFPGFPMYWAY